MYTYPPLNAYLSDPYGYPLCPYTPGSILYNTLESCSNDTGSRQVVHLACHNANTVLIKGYITVHFGCEGRSRTVPFNIPDCIHLPIKNRTDIRFKTTLFQCMAVPVLDSWGMVSDSIRVFIYIKSTATARYLNNNKITYQSFTFDKCTSSFVNINILKADVIQYNALSDGKKRTYTNQDELRQYSSQGLPDPTSMSFHDLFVNGMIQPKTNYELGNGYLNFKTEDVPAAGEPISVSYLSLKDHYHRKLSIHTLFYIAIADGIRNIYTDNDALWEYGCKGIPNPQNVSYFNLFVNGVLQPPAVYTVTEGILEMSEAPKKGQYIVLESLKIKTC